MDGTATRVLVDQLSAIDPQRLGEFAGRLDPGEMEQIDSALRGVLGLF